MASSVPDDVDGDAAHFADLASKFPSVPHDPVTRQKYIDLATSTTNYDMTPEETALLIGMVRKLGINLQFGVTSYGIQGAYLMMLINVACRFGIH